MGLKHRFLIASRGFSQTDHKYRKNRNDLFVGRVEKDVALPISSVKNCMM